MPRVERQSPIPDPWKFYLSPLVFFLVGEMRTTHRSADGKILASRKTEVKSLDCELKVPDAAKGNNSASWMDLDLGIIIITLAK